VKAIIMVDTILFMLFFGYTQPTVSKYFITLVDANIIALANVIRTLLAAVAFYLLSKESNKENITSPIIILLGVCSIVGYACSNIIALDYPVIRFIGNSMLDVIDEILGLIIIKDGITLIIDTKKGVLNFQSLRKSYRMFAGLIGSATATLLPVPDVTICVYIQIITIAVCHSLWIVAYLITQKISK
jgi:hypothetical protein